jgi:hypothetical protein
VRSDYENTFPNEKDQIELAIKEAETAAWGTPFPALFFPPLAHLKVRERIALAERIAREGCFRLWRRKLL